LRKPIQKLRSFLIETIDKALNVSYRSRKEKSWQVGLVFFSILLSIASGYTTFSGLSELFFGPFALLATFGIQGLLYTSSWRIGVVRHQNKINFNLILIFSFTVASSIFFSWVDILDSIYKEDSRRNDELNYSISKSNEMLLNFNKNAVLFVEQKSSDILLNLRKWDYINDSLLSKYEGKVYAPFLTAQKEVNRLDSILHWELTSGFGTSTTGGKGQRYRTFKVNRDEYFTNTFLPLKAEEEEVKKSKKSYLDAFEKLISSKSNLTNANLTVCTQNLKAFSTAISAKLDSTISLYDIPEEVVIDIGSLSSVNEFLLDQNKRYNVEKATSTEQIKDTLRTFIADLRNYYITQDLGVEKFLQKIDDIGKFGGEKAHPYALAIGGLSRGEPLAYISLIIALIIDFLILFCSLLSNPEGSFLSMEKPSDLLPLQELALEVVYSISTKESVKSSQPYIKKISEILEASVSEVDLAQIGYPVSISYQKISALKIDQAIATLVALKLAKVDKKNKKVFLRTKLLLWMGEQVMNTKYKLQTERNIRKNLEENSEDDLESRIKQVLDKIK